MEPFDLTVNQDVCLKALSVLGIALAFFFPIALNFSLLAGLDSRVVHLLYDGFAGEPSIFIYMCATLFCLFLLCLLGAHVVYVGVRVVFSRIGVNDWLAGFVAPLIYILFLYAINLIFFPFSAYNYNIDFLPLPWLWIAGGALFALVGMAVIFCKFRKISMASFSLMFIFIMYDEYLPVVRSENAPVSPNIIFIGVDSLSMSAFESHGAHLQYISELVNNGVHYSRAYSNVGRTYPAWMSILTGVYPAKHGAFFNLREISRSAEQDSIGHTLGVEGYHRIFALDERRFNNMDSSFGFDKIVGPKAGLLDFIMPRITDNPLANSLLQLRVSRWVFPWSWNNVAAVSSYSDDGFVNDVLRTIRADQPNFLAVHFETAHFPFRTRHASLNFKSDSPLWTRYIKALNVVDDQVGLLMQGLEERGLLEDALVVLFSDHGEGVGRLETVIPTAGGELGVRSYGHGSNLLSDHQNRIVLAVVRYHNNEPIGEPRAVAQQVSLVDIRPAFERFLAGDDFTLKSQDCTLVETGIRLSAVKDYKTLSESEVARQGALFYRVTGGLMHLREDKLSELIVRKDIGLRCQTRITWFSANDRDYLSYALNPAGMPVVMVEPSEHDKLEIDAYKTTLVKEVAKAEASLR